MAMVVFVRVCYGTYVEEGRYVRNVPIPYVHYSTGSLWQQPWGPGGGGAEGGCPEKKKLGKGTKKGAPWLQKSFSPFAFVFDEGR